MQFITLTFGILSFLIAISMAIKLGTYKFKDIDDIPYKLGLMFFGTLSSLMFYLYLELQKGIT